MRITGIRTIQLRRPLERPQRHARGGRDVRCFTFVLVDTDAGITGLGEAAGDELIMETIIEKRLRPMAIGLDPCDVTKLLGHAIRIQGVLGASRICCVRH